VGAALVVAATVLVPEKKAQAKVAARARRLATDAA
jgi:hypothetical protein